MIRKLNRKEHDRTRKLWEEIFAEDSGRFLDYYYTEVAGQNEIYVVENKNDITQINDITENTGRKSGEIHMASLEEDTGEIHAMLQLNPYQIRAGAYSGKINYIVGVATKETYRGRGFMAGLLRTSCQDMYRDKQPFTFLMPAAEAIYYPHGFRFIYSQKRGQITAKNARPELICEIASEEDLTEVALFARKMLENCDVCAERTAAYYRRIRKEQISENGGIVLLKTGNHLKGILCFASEGEYFEIREPLLEADEPEKALWLAEAAYRITGKENVKVHCEGFGFRNKLVIMARVIHLQTFFKCFTAQTDVNGTLKVRDDMLEENTGIWQISARPGEPLTAVKAGVCEKEAVTVAMLMSCLSGQKTIAEAAGEEGVVLSAETKRLLRAIRPWKKVFLNEIV